MAVVGMHRAGTSMVAKALRLGGVYLGSDEDLVDPAPDNPEGFYEHASFVELDDDLLEAAGGAWDQPPEWPPAGVDDPRVAHLAERAAELAGTLERSPAWGWKDPRASLLGRFWLDVVPDLRFVVCLRHPLEVALSLKRRNKASYAHGLALWRTYYATLLDAVPADRRLVTHYDRHFEDVRGEAARLLAFAGVEGNAARRARDPALRHHQVDVSLVDAGVEEATIELYGELCEEAGVPQHAEAAVATRRGRRIDRRTLDLHLAEVESDRRGRQVKTLQRERDQLVERLSGLERAVFEVRLTELSRSGRDDVPVLRRCGELLHEHVPPGSRVIVVAKDDPVWLGIGPWSLVNFPVDRSGRYPGFTFANAISAIAHLEARRADGVEYLLLPDTASWWRERYPEFLTHLHGYAILADEPGASLLVDLRARRARAGSEPRTVAEIVERLAARNGEEPSVLDWTNRNFVELLPGRNVFTPPGGDELPYLDRTVDLVLIEADAWAAAGSRSEQARRVASSAVVAVAAQGAAIEAVEYLGGDIGHSEPVRFVPVGQTADQGSRAMLEEAIQMESNARIADADAWEDIAAEDGIVALIEHNAIPLPGCCDAARRLLASGEGGAVAVKLLGPEGALEAAGTAVFADGSVVGVACGDFDVAAPWHELVRDSCGSAGMLFIGGGGLREIARTGGAPGDHSLTAWAGLLWRSGVRVAYQPEAAALRLTGGADPADRGVPEAWEPALPLRPRRPDVLDDAAWRTLLAGDDVAAAWRPVANHR